MVQINKSADQFETLSVTAKLQLSEVLMSLIGVGPAKKVITFNYILKDTKGQVLDSSGGEPMAFLTGTGQIIPALEEQLTGMLIGSKKTVHIAAKEAYGDNDPKMIIEVPKTDLAHIQIEVGAFLQLNLGQQLKVVRVASIAEDIVTLDGNHPLAGQDLVFDVEMMNSREATAEEQSHGHAHGVGGHHH